MTITGEYITDYLEICENIKEYRKREFDETFDKFEEIFDENLNTPLAYTTLDEDEQISIQVTLELTNLRMVQEVSFKYNNGNCNYNDIEIEKYKDMKEVINVTKHLDFDDLVFVDKDYEEIYNSLNYC
ncbi:hypothetical protein [Staphylococcus epidermidis]|uniref:hypothetical protein n=2 Tax=Bacteria TaxID=2 RepID=UPI001BD16FC1|nr:hypothetical protein [Staphylococcus epidermidis]